MKQQNGIQARWVEEEGLAYRSNISAGGCIGEDRYRWGAHVNAVMNLRIP
jgi:hypothetical protein